MKNYADAVAFLGQWGCFQQTVFLLLCASIMPNGYGAFILIFLTDTPSHYYCLVPDVNLTDKWRESVIPITVVEGNQEQSRCSRYRLDVVKNLSAQGFIPGRDINLTDLEQEDCVDGWSYSKDVYQSTIVTQFDLVCSEQWKQPVTTTIFFMGVFCGSFFSGHMSDRYGRKPVLFLTIGLQTAFTFAQVFSTSWIMFLILLFFNGLGQMSNFVAALVLGAEILTGNIRVLYSSLGSNLSFAIGYMVLPLCAYFLRDWKSLLLVLSVPCLVFIPLWWVIPESPRWLLSQGRVEEAEAIVRKAAKWNKVQAPRVIFEDCNINASKNEKEKFNVFDLFRRKIIRTTTLLLCIVSCSRNPSILFQLDGTTIPSTTAVCRWYADPCSHATVLRSSSARKSIWSVSHTGDVLRNTATATTSTVSRMGSCITPFLLSLSVYYNYVPYITLASLALLSAFAALFLPESFKQPLPESIQQMHQRGRIKCPCITGNKTSVPVEPLDGPL
ncbi:solute carrier family 22 member 4-like isoform X2 [Melanotaenia boesemani]|uniref:solute carrier family 22 member 4-like isoform X2 n=1 Tax=Melanotaenia boesemani TaxID=1250792 RepID=UPI001C0525C0|nr:solute carrier family 22 member 4-like isoform X2 [Melanotaenia boesemani]